MFVSRQIYYQMILGMVFGALYLTFTPRAIAQSLVTIPKVDIANFPEIQLVVRVANSQRQEMVTNLQPENFTIQESTSVANRAGIKPAMIKLDGGPPLAVAIILETRNNSTREELNAARDFARELVTLLARIPRSDYSEETDYVQIWAPRASDLPLVSDGQANLSGGFVPLAATPVPHINAINGVLPSAETSAGLDKLIGQVLNIDTGSAHLVLITIGKVAQLTPTMDAGTLAAFANQKNISIYHVDVGSDAAAQTYFQNLTTSTTGNSMTADIRNVSDLFQAIQRKYKGQYLLTYRSALTPMFAQSNQEQIGHDLKLDVTLPNGSITSQSVLVPLTPLVQQPQFQNRVRLWGLALLLLFVVGLLVLWRATINLGVQLRRRSSLPVK